MTSLLHTVTHTVDTQQQNVERIVIDLTGFMVRKNACVTKETIMFMMLALLSY